MAKKRRRRHTGGYMVEGLRPRKRFRLKRTAMKAIARARKAGKRVSLRKLARNTLYATANKRHHSKRRTSRRGRRTSRNPKYVVVNGSRRRARRNSRRRHTRRNTRRRHSRR